MASGRPRGSSVWDYFEFSEAENKSVCVVNAGDSKPDSEPCGAKIAGKYPTNLRKHLEKFHKKEYDEMERKEKEKKEEEAKKVSSFKKSKSPTSPSIESSLDNISKIEEEMCLYEKQYLEISEDTDPIEFWLSSAHSYPKLFDVATDILSVPASSAPVERVFSVSGDACRGKRNRLSGQNLERETLLRVNKAILL